MSGGSYGYDLIPELGAVEDAPPNERRRAARAIASRATDAADAAWLLAAVGLTAAEGKS